MLEVSFAAWAATIGLIAELFALDLFVSRPGHARPVGFREATLASIFSAWPEARAHAGCGHVAHHGQASFGADERLRSRNDDFSWERLRSPDWSSVSASTSRRDH
jgi:hypothetical protein